jgi:hypothetical protein
MFHVSCFRNPGGTAEGCREKNIKNTRFPGVETPGYYQMSLRDSWHWCPSGICIGRVTPRTASTLKRRSPTNLTYRVGLSPLACSPSVRRGHTQTKAKGALLGEFQVGLFRCRGRDKFKPGKPGLDLPRSEFPSLLVGFIHLCSLAATFTARTKTPGRISSANWSPSDPQSPPETWSPRGL